MKNNMRVCVYYLKNVTIKMLYVPFVLQLNTVSLNCSSSQANNDVEQHCGGERESVECCAVDRLELGSRYQSPFTDIRISYTIAYCFQPLFYTYLFYGNKFSCLNLNFYEFMRDMLVPVSNSIQKVQKFYKFTLRMPRPRSGNKV